MNMISVKINDVQYNLKGEENEEYLIKVANYVDKKLKYIMKENNKLSTSSASILVAVNIADEMFKTEENVENLEDKIEGLQKELESKEKELEKIKQEFEIMTEETKKHLKEVNVLNAQNKELNFQLQNSKYKIMELENNLLKGKKEDHK